MAFNAAWVWIDPSVVLAIHDEQLAEHGGPAGVRDAGLLASALGRPRNQAASDEPDVSSLAAAYGFGLVRDHPFVDGNERTAFVITELFLLLHGWRLAANDAECVFVMLRLAGGEIDEAAFAGWLRARVERG